MRRSSLAVVLVALTGCGAAAAVPAPDAPAATLNLAKSIDIDSVVDVMDEFADVTAINMDAPLPTASSEINFRNLQTGETTTTKRVNIWETLKNSLGLAIVGCLLIFCMPCLIWKNEGRHVRELSRIDFCKNKAVVVEDASSPLEENTGRLVHFIGEVSAGDEGTELTPTALNVTKPVPRALIVKRTCYIYQKFEDADTQTQKDIVGGGKTQTTTFRVREDWTSMGPQPDHLEHLKDESNSRGVWDQLVSAAGGGVETALPAANPKLPPGMDINKLPPEMIEQLGLMDPNKAPHGLAVSAVAHVGGFRLSKDIITEEPAAFSTEWAPIPTDFLPGSVEGCEGLMKGSDNVLRTFPEGDEPKNGDCKVVYEYVEDGFDCSFIVEQVLPANANDPEVGGAYGVDKCDVIDEKCFGMCKNDLGFIRMVRRGKHDMAEMIDMAKEDEKKLTKVLRIVCWVGLLAGWIMLFSPFTAALSVLPILGQLGYFAVVIIALIVSCLCCGTVTILAYFRYRPFISLGLLALAGGIWGIVSWRLNYAAENGGGT